MLHYFTRLTKAIRAKTHLASTSRGRHRHLRVEFLEDRSLLAPLTWSSGIDLPTPRAGAAAINEGGSILAIGGGTTIVNRLYPGGSFWSATNSIDIARTYAGVGLTGSNYLVYGGQSGNTALEEALTYSPTFPDNVQDASIMSPPRTQFGYATDDELHPFAIGGLDDQNRPLSSVAIYDASTDSWSTVAPLPQTLYGEAAVNDGDGHLLTFGGVDASGSETSTVYRYTFATNSWDTVEPLPVAERDGAAVLADNGRIYVIGGTVAGIAIATVQSYDPTSDTWALESNLPAPLSSAAAASDSLGHIVVLGGYDQNHVALAAVIVSQDLSAPDAAPVFTSTAPASVLVGLTYTYQVTTTGNPQATYSLVSAPPGMTIDAARGLITWTPTTLQAGLNTVTVRATNFSGSAEQIFSVRAFTPAPTVPTGLAAANVTTNSITLSWSPSTDSIGVAGYRVYRVGHTGWRGNTTVYSRVADVPGTIATISGLSTGTTYQYVLTAYNPSGNESTRSTSISIRTLSPIVYTGPTSVFATANHPLSFNLSASANPATFTYTALDVSTGLPLDPASGLTVNPTTGLVTWTPTDSDVGTDNFSFRIDHILGSVTVLVAITVGPNVPYATYSPIGTAVATQPLSVQFSQNADPYNTSPVIYSLVNGPAGMAIDSVTGLLTWTPGLTDLGTANATVQIANYAGSTNTSVSIPVVFASAVQNVAISHIGTTSATVTWEAPAVSSEPIVGYRITASYTVRSGRFNTTHTLSFLAAASDTSLVLTGLPVNKLLSVSVSAYDGGNLNGLAGRTSFTTAAAIPNVMISGGPYIYDGTPHDAVAMAFGTNGVTPVSGGFTYTYDGSSTPPTLPGTYAVVAAFTSADPYYAEALGSGSITILPATPQVTVVAAPVNYDGQPHAATATAVGIDGMTPINGSYSFSYDGSATPPVGPGVFSVIATFSSADPLYANAIGTGTLVIKSTGTQIPTLALTGTTSTYDGSPHGVSATAADAANVPLAGTFTYTYNGSPTPPTDAGVYDVVATFASGDPNYRDGTITGLLTIARAVPMADIGWFTFPGWGPTPAITYDGLPHEATAVAYGINGTNVPGTFDFTYGSSSTPINAGEYIVQAMFTSNDPNYADSSFSATLTIDTYWPYVDVIVDPPAYAWYYGQYYSTYTGAPQAASGTAYGVDGSALPGSLTTIYYAYDPTTYWYTAQLDSPPVDVGTYLIQADFISADPNYASTSGYTYLQIDPASPTVIVSGVFDYNGLPRSAIGTAYGVDSMTPVGGVFTYYYDGSTTAPTAAGTYAVDAYFTSADPNYYDGSASDFITINKVTPNFANLSAPTITAGTANTTISGRLASGTVYPTGDAVSITINGVTRTANVGGTGNFSVSFPTGTLAVGSYPINYSFAGDAIGFNPAAGVTRALTVNPALVAPSIIANPSSQSAIAGSSITFTAAATGNPTPTVQWQVSTNGGGTYSNIPGATSTSLTIATTSTQNGYRYRAVFTNSVGTVTTTSATLTVQFAPTVTTNPANQTTLAGNNVTFSAAATGNPAPTVQWQVSTNGGGSYTNVTGATSTSLTVATSATQNGYRYRVVFTNSIGAATSTVATLTVQVAPTVTTNPTSQTIRAGSSVSFIAAASGNPRPTVRWQVSTNGGGSYTNIAGATNATLTLTTSATQNGNRYRAVFTNSVGAVTTTAAILTVQSAPVVTTNPTNRTVTAGQSVSFTAAATGNPAPTVQWQMSTNGGTTYTNIAGATNTTLTFIAATSQRGYRYRAVFTNSIGTATTTAAILTV